MALTKSSEDQLFRIRLRIWRARGRNSRITGAIFLAVSAIFFFLAYFTQLLLFEISSIILLLFGIVMIFTGSERYVKIRTSNSAIKSSLYSFGELLCKIPNLENRSFYIPFKNSSVKVFIPEMNSNVDSLDVTDENQFIHKGLLVKPVGDDLCRLIEAELGGFIGLDHFLEYAKSAIVEGLNLAEDIEVRNKENTGKIEFLFKNPFFILENTDEVSDRILKLMGCPLCSAVAEAVALNTQKVVNLEYCTHDQWNQTIKLSLIVGT